MGSPVAVHPFFHGPPTPRYRSASDSQIQAEGGCKPFRGETGQGCPECGGFHHAELADPLDFHREARLREWG